MPEEVPPVPGVNMGTGAQEGYFGTTNKENAVGSKRSNFLINEKIVRPEFETNLKKTRRGNTATEAAVAAEDEPVRKDGHPSGHCRKLLPKLILARPKDFFDTQLTPDFWSWTVDATNYRAMAGGATTGEFADFVQFDLAEVNKFIGLLFLNGLSPKPQMEFWFEGAASEPLFGNDKNAEVMKKKNRMTGRTISGKRRWRHFRRFFSMASLRCCSSSSSLTVTDMSSSKSALWMSSSCLMILGIAKKF
jgi:hypothetical protein